jgi:nucleoid-associated protein YgaU
MAEEDNQPDASGNPERSAASEPPESQSAEASTDAEDPGTNEPAKPRTELARRWLEAQAERSQRRAERSRATRNAAPRQSPRRQPDQTDSPSAAGRTPLNPASSFDPAQRERSATRTAGSPQDGRSEAARTERAAAPTEPDTEKPRNPQQEARPTESRTHTIQEGETFSSLARRFYGHTKHWKRIAEANPDVDPGRLKVGQKIRLPGLESKPSGPQRQTDDPRDQRTANPDPATDDEPQSANPPAEDSGPRSVRVRSGDTLSSIAERVYGDPGRWERILEANRDRIDQPESLQVGTELRVPAEPTAADAGSP